MPILFLDIFDGHSAMVVIPFAVEGTLKQMIEGLRRQVDGCGPTNSVTSTAIRSSFMSTSLIAPVSSSLVNIYSLHEMVVRRLARQVLEAVVFLHDKGFRPYGRFTSSDVIMQNGTARLMGVENVFLRGIGLKANLLAPDEDYLSGNANRTAIDTISFGQLFWELVEGHRLETPKPAIGQLVNYQKWPMLYAVSDFMNN